MPIRTTVLPTKIAKTFAALCVMHPPRAISDNVDYDNTVEVIDRLATLPKLNLDQNEYLETLTILVEKFDADRFLDFKVRNDPIARLKRLMENHDLSASDIGRILGNRALGAAILRGDRAISKANALRLAEHFKMSPAAFLKV